LVEEGFGGVVPGFVAAAGLRADAGAGGVAGFFVNEAADEGHVVVDPAGEFHQALAVGAGDVDVAVDGGGVVGEAALDGGARGVVALGLRAEGAGHKFPAVGEFHVSG
jgi:hypothetical protein